MTINKLLLLPASLLIYTFVTCSTKKALCDSVRNGTFYFYGKQSGHQFLIMRLDSVQKEYNYITGDTSFWSVHWTNDCEYTGGYLGGMKNISSEMQEFMLSHKLFFKILEVQSDFYRLEINSEKFPNQRIVDTVWRTKL